MWQLQAPTVLIRGKETLVLNEQELDGTQSRSVTVITRGRFLSTRQESGLCHHPLATNVARELSQIEMLIQRS